LDVSLVEQPGVPNSEKEKRRNMEETISIYRLTPRTNMGPSVLTFCPKKRGKKKLE